MNAFAVATMLPMTANQNSQCVAVRGGRGDQPAVRTCPAIYPPPIAIAAAQSHAFAFATFLEVDGERLGYATYGEVTGDFERVTAAFDFCALEDHRRKLFRVEEIRTLQASFAN